MFFNPSKTSTKLSVIALIGAVAILLFIAAVSYRQTIAFQKSADQVSHTFKVEKEIHKIFTYFTLVESAHHRYLLEQDTKTIQTITNNKELLEEAMIRFKKLTEDNFSQQKNIKDLYVLRDSLYGNYASLTDSLFLKSTDTITETNLNFAGFAIMDNIQALKNKMVLEEEKLLQLRNYDLDTENAISPFTSLISVLFSLFVFVIAFEKINSDRKRLANTEAFLHNIITSTKYTIMHFAPIRNDINKVIDFKLLYVNASIKAITGKTPQELLGKTLSSAFPSTFKSGIFEKMVSCLESGKTIDYESNYNANGKETSFYATATRLGDGVTITTRENTEEKEAKEALQALNEKLSAQNLLLKETERMAKVGTYRRVKGKDIAAMSDNFYRLLDCEPNDFDCSFETYRSFVHPDDLEDYTKREKEAFNKKAYPPHTYRVITKNKKVKYFESSGYFIEEGGEEYLIGVIKDVTLLFKNQQKLKDKNLDLKRSNAELESFSRVASHDLQEPLRKIQVFISLILDTEKLSKTAKSYFEKVHNSANRMQELINNLLDYSRFTKTSKKTVMVDLNEIMVKVIEDQNVAITAGNVKLFVKPLPSLKASPFQMEQLFNNLLSNAIKYRSTNRPLEIEIDYQIINRNKIPYFFQKKARNFYEISFKDNGIGFNQQNAAKVFELFQRLHQNEEYTGSGIGLSICKRIVENHKGYIWVTSEIDKGSTFTIYFPI